MRTPDQLFTLKYRLRDGVATITAWEVWSVLPDGSPNPRYRANDSHTTIDVELRWHGCIIFARGETWCGVPGGTTTDGIAAKELVTSCFTIKPGDTDSDYFAHYTQDQLEWVETYGEELDCEKQSRYCDPETGEVRR